MDTHPLSSSSFTKDSLVDASKDDDRLLMLLLFLGGDAIAPYVVVQIAHALMILPAGKYRPVASLLLPDCDNVKEDG